MRRTRWMIVAPDHWLIVGAVIPGEAEGWWGQFMVVPTAIVILGLDLPGSKLESCWEIRLEQKGASPCYKHCYRVVARIETPSYHRILERDKG